MGLASALPSTPGYVGIYQFVAVSVLTPFGFSRTDAIAYIPARAGAHISRNRLLGRHRILAVPQDGASQHRLGGLSAFARERSSYSPSKVSHSRLNGPRCFKS